MPEKVGVRCPCPPARRSGASAGRDARSSHDRRDGWYSRAKRAATPCPRTVTANGHGTTHVSSCSRRRPARSKGLLRSVSGPVHSSTVWQYVGRSIRACSSERITPSAMKRRHRVSDRLCSPITRSRTAATRRDLPIPRPTRQAALGGVQAEEAIHRHRAGDTFQRLRAPIGPRQIPPHQAVGGRTDHDRSGRRDPLQAGRHIRRVAERQLSLSAAPTHLTDDHQAGMDADAHRQSSPRLGLRSQGEGRGMRRWDEGHTTVATILERRRMGNPAPGTRSRHGRAALAAVWVQDVPSHLRHILRGHEHPTGATSSGWPARCTIDGVRIEGHRHGPGHHKAAHELEQGHGEVWMLVHNRHRPDRYGDLAHDEAADGRHRPVYGQIDCLCPATTRPHPLLRALKGTGSPNACDGALGDERCHQLIRSDNGPRPVPQFPPHRCPSSADRHQHTGQHTPALATSGKRSG
jgi:hypothetical protein